MSQARTFRKLLLATVGATLVVPVAAHAQSVDGADSGEIFVTARKREETLVDVPLSIQAFTADDIAKSGVGDLQDLSRFTPSLNFVNGSQGTGGRVLSEVRFRGLGTNVPTPTNQTGSVFVDGIFVLGGAQSLGFEDIDRVEVIKGPQAAYFGRSTFGGAVNYITRDPRADFSGSINTSYSPTYGSYSLSASVEGTIVEDLLLARFSGSTRHKGAQWTASDGGELGREQTDAINTTLMFTPSPDVRLKLRGSYIEDNDGPSSSGYHSFNGYNNCPIGTPQTVLTNKGQLNTVLGRNFWCGDIPFRASVIDTNTGLVTLPAMGADGPTDLREVFVGNLLNDPILAQAPRLDRMGMTRWMVRLSGTLDWDISDQLALTVAGGYNKQKSNTIRDTDGTKVQSGYQAVPMTFEDGSAEARLRFDNGSWLNASIGFNYFKQTILADTDNGVSVTNQSVVAGRVQRNVTSSTNNENDEVETKGFFAGADIKPVDWATLTLEGRYQIDDYTRFNGNNASGNLSAYNIRSKNFTPRVILTVNPVKDATVYGSYSIGTLPGVINSNFVALSPELQQAVRDAAPDIQVQLDSQKLISWEVGYKQYFREIGLTVSLAAFTMEWQNLQGSSAVIVPAILNNPVFTVTMPGQARIKGIEFESNWRATDKLTLRAAAGYLSAKYTDYTFRGSNPIFSIPTTGDVTYKVDGNTIPRNPNVTASGSATWTDTLFDDWNYRVRADVVHSGRQYATETNLASIAPYTVTNLTLGFENDKYSVELFAKNLFDQTAWMSGRAFVDLASIPLNFTTAGQGVFLTPIDRREVGLTFGMKF